MLNLGCDNCNMNMGILKTIKSTGEIYYTQFMCSGCDICVTVYDNPSEHIIKIRKLEMRIRELESDIQDDGPEWPEHIIQEIQDDIARSASGENQCTVTIDGERCILEYGHALAIEHSTIEDKTSTPDSRNQEPKMADTFDGESRCLFEFAGGSQCTLQRRHHGKCEPE